MHVPAEMLNGGICPVTAIISGVVVSLAAVSVVKNKTLSQKKMRFLLVTATLFLLQMLNYKIGNGVSAHIIGGVFAVGMLGIPAAILSMTLVLALQAFLLGDGGTLQLGINDLNMAVIGAGVAGYIFNLLQKKLNFSSSVIIASILGVLLPVCVLGFEFFITGEADISFTMKLLSAHLWVACIEAGVSLVLLSLLTQERWVAQRQNIALATLAGLLFFALPYASEYPDAFEATVAQFR